MTDLDDLTGECERLAGYPTPAEPSAAQQLRDLVLEPWCYNCNRPAAPSCPNDADHCGCPPLWKRWPQTKPDGLNWKLAPGEGFHDWALFGTFVHPVATTALCVARMVEVLPGYLERGHSSKMGHSPANWWIHHQGHTSRGPTLLHALVAACHKHLDSQNATGSSDS